MTGLSETFEMMECEQVAVLSRLQAMREQGLLTDFIIRASEGGRVEELKTHRCVLASNDGFFGALLAGAGSSMREAEVDSIDLDVDPELLEMVVHFLYGGKVSVDFERIMDLLAVAVRLQVRALAAQCTETLRRHINERNCVELLRASAAHGCAELRAAAHDAVVTWLPTLLRNKPAWHGNKERCASEDSGDLLQSGGAIEERAASERVTRRAARRVAERDATLSRASSRADRTPALPPGPSSLTTSTSSAGGGGFSTLPAALAMEILGSDRIACDESLIFEAAVAWVEAHDLSIEEMATSTKKRARRSTLSSQDHAFSEEQQPKKRRRTTVGSARDLDVLDSERDTGTSEHSEATLDEILARVRYPLMDATFLSDVVKPHPAMQTTLRQALIAEAFEHIALRAAGRDRGLLECPRTELEQLADRLRPRKHCVAARPWPPLFDLARPFDHENGHTDAVAALCVCAGRVVSGSWDSTVRVWDPETGNCERVFEDHVGTVRALADVAHCLVSTSEDGNIRVWDPRRGWALVQTLRDHSDVVNAIVALDDNEEQQQHHHTGGGTQNDGQPTAILNPVAGDLSLGQATHDQADSTLTISNGRSRSRSQPAAPDPARRFASGGDDGVIKIWSTSDWRCQLTLHGEDHVGVLVLASTAGMLICGCDDAKIHVWSIRTWQLEHTLVEHSDEVWALAVVGDNLISGSGQSPLSAAQCFSRVVNLSVARIGMHHARLQVRLITRLRCGERGTGCAKKL